MNFDLQGIGMTSQRTRDRLVAALQGEGITDHRVLDTLRAVPRHIFIDEALAHRAYENTALPIGFGQTISQPYIVALMTQLLLADRPSKVLEVGTGCGYQTSVLAKMVRRVFTIERVAELVPYAAARFKALGLNNVIAKLGDGYEGWPVHEPFDAILVTAAASEVPAALLEQLAVGGRLVVPVGDDSQHLRLIERTADGFNESSHGAVRFVPMLHGTTG
ncbi:MAG: protein-L-isoaspartate(D-aspartate) O-methyltransferase [Pseudomonadota bacterium]